MVKIKIFALERWILFLSLFSGTFLYDMAVYGLVMGTSLQVRYAVAVVFLLYIFAVNIFYSDQIGIKSLTKNPSHCMASK